MRRMLMAGAVAAVGLLSACEPTMTITASQVQPACLNNAIEGTVTPASATPKVVLQRTMNGKWVDWKWYFGSDVTAKVLSSPVDQDGHYEIGYESENPSGGQLAGTLHLRVRSDGGTPSNSLYVKFPKSC